MTLAEVSGESKSYLVERSYFSGQTSLGVRWLDHWVDLLFYHRDIDVNDRRSAPIPRVASRIPGVGSRLRKESCQGRPYGRDRLFPSSLIASVGQLRRSPERLLSDSPANPQSRRAAGAVDGEFPFGTGPAVRVRRANDSRRRSHRMPSGVGRPYFEPVLTGKSNG